MHWQDPDRGVRLAEALAETFPPLSDHEAFVESNRCLYCYDAPCTHACPTHIDVPRFIKKIATDNLVGSARTILEANLLGATCARVCPVQELCEGACVLGAEHKPIAIGRLQRHALDRASGRAMEQLAAVHPTSKTVAVIGAGPAGLSCAGELARRGHAVTVFERRALPGGLSTYGIISLREPAEIAIAESELVRSLGVRFKHGLELGIDLSVNELQTSFDAVFLAVGLAGSPSLMIPGAEFIVGGLTFIEGSKLDPAALVVGRHVAVVGGGNTAIDCATVAKRLGAETVTIIYRRSVREMPAYSHEYEFIKNEGVAFQFLSQPIRVLTNNGQVVGLECVRISLGAPDSSGRPAPRAVAGSEFVMPVDQVIKAIGQQAVSLGLRTKHGFLKVTDDFETSVSGVYAGGDCIRSSGSASTVMAVQDGKLAAAAIHKRLSVKEGQ